MSEDAKGFDADWLALREPLDRDARAATGLDARLAAWLDGRRAGGADERAKSSFAGTVSIVDLGCGSGSNLRYLLPLLGAGQRWRAVDNDPALLETLGDRLGAWADARGASVETAPDGALHVRGDGFDATVARERRDLAADLAGLDLAGTDLVTASALLDLCSARWIDALVEACAAARAAGLFVLDYDGDARWTPPHDDDERVRALVNRHQLRDKGFGPALGPGAGAFAARRFAELGHEVRTARSVWEVGPDEAALHVAYLEGWADAAREQAPDGGSDAGEAARATGPEALPGARIDAWLDHRRDAAANGTTRLAVGHHDVLALPPSGGPSSGAPR